MRGKEGGGAHCSLWQRIKLALSELTLAMVAILQAVPHHSPQAERESDRQRVKIAKEREGGGMEGERAFEPIVNLPDPHCLCNQAQISLN